jgi:hypothetical protein
MRGARNSSGFLDVSHGLKGDLQSYFYFERNEPYSFKARSFLQGLFQIVSVNAEGRVREHFSF